MICFPADSFRKVTQEMHKLTDELSKDKKSWEKSDWKMNDLIETW